MKDDLRNELYDRFVTATVELYRLMYKGLLGDRKGPGKMSPQLGTMLLLADKGPQRVNHIAHHIGCTPPATTNILDRLMAKKLVKRVPDPQDRRVVICELACEGREFLNQISRDIRERVLAVTVTWSLERLEAVVEALESVPPADSSY